MISEAGAIRTLVIDLNTLQIQSCYWEMLVPRYEIVYVERYEEDGQLLIWNHADGRSVSYSYSEGAFRCSLSLMQQQR